MTTLTLLASIVLFSSNLRAEVTWDINGDGKVIGLALSGGGLRATGIAYGALKELDARGLLRNVDLISAVSGGSIVGAYYSLGLPLDEFGEKLGSNLLLSSVGKVFNFKNFGDGRRNTRTTGFADTLDELYFQNRKLTDLKKQPLLLINTTNIATTSLFVFSRNGAGGENLNGTSDLPFYRLTKDVHRETKVSTAVAASCAVPSLLAPMRIKAVKASSKGKTAVTIELVDGGVFDNAGLETLLVRRCDVIISIDASATVITEEGYRYFSPGGTKVIPIIRRRYRELLNTHTRSKLLDSFIHIGMADDEVKKMRTIKTKLTKKDLELLVKHGREMVVGNIDRIKKNCIP